MALLDLSLDFSSILTTFFPSHSEKFLMLCSKKIFMWNLSKKPSILRKDGVKEERPYQYLPSGTRCSDNDL